MSAYAAWFAAEARLRLQYRAAALAGVVTQLFFGFTRVQALAAFYAVGGAPLGAAAAADYVWLSQAMIMLLPGVDSDVVGAVRGGGLATELLRPTDAYWLWAVRGVARRSVQTALRGVPLVTIALACGLLRPPASGEAAALFLLSLPLAAALSASLALAAAMTTFWTVSADGVAVALSVAAWGFAGVTLPLPLFPDALQGLIAASPLRGLIDTPARLWTGDLAGAAAYAALAHLIAWIAALVAVGRLLLARGLRRLVHFGG